MEEYIIIRAGVNGGKTTTCGLLYKELEKNAEYAQLFNAGFKEISELQYSPEGHLYDFIGVIILNHRLIIIISQGDVARYLKSILDKLLNVELVKQITKGKKDAIDFIVCTGRSQMRVGSTIEMIFERINMKQRKVFWTIKSDDPDLKESIKMDVVNRIKNYILN